MRCGCWAPPLYGTTLRRLLCRSTPCLRLAPHTSAPQGGSRRVLREQVRQAFKKNKDETDPQKIEEQKEA